jgi:CTD small phosphatase-like protein 2
VAQTDFYVAMPHLLNASLLLEEFPPSLRNALHFIIGTDMPDGGGGTGEADLLEPRPQGEDRLTLVLDLDETLVHCRTDMLPDIRHNFCVRFEESQATGWIYVRPFARLFLEIVSRLFEVVVFTASSRSYADQVLDTLDPEGKCISRRLYRQHCTEVGGGFVKDMSRLGRSLERVILVDNSPVSLAMCPDNGVLVAGWTAEQHNDRELVDLLLLLQQCMQHHSVSDYLSKRYGLRAFLEELRAWPELLGDF